MRPRLRPNAPQLRTAQAIVEKHEQIFDALEHDRITPKTAEQMGQQLKGILALEQFGFRYQKFLWEHRKERGAGVPVPRSPILRNLIGLPAEASTTDEETVRAMLPDVTPSSAG